MRPRCLLAAALLAALATTSLPAAACAATPHRDSLPVGASPASRTAVVGAEAAALAVPPLPFALQLAADSAGAWIGVDLAARRLYYVEQGVVRFSAPVAVGRGTPSTTMVSAGRFATPRGRFAVLRKEENPLWVPPDWHFAERARRTGRRIAPLGARDTLVSADGSRFFVRAGRVVRQGRDGAIAPLPVTGREIEVDDVILRPPVGTVQRRYPGVLGGHRLVLRDGYGIHGTTERASIGRAASHGCVRMLNEDIALLFPLVAQDTPVLFF